MRVLIVDNDDSFTWNLAQLVEALGAVTEVVSHRDAPVTALDRFAPTHVILGPGPGGPEQAQGASAVLERVHGRLPLLGVCLGHQLLGLRDGARIDRGPEPVHGKASLAHHDGRTIFVGLPQPMPVGRYHSLVIAPGTLSADYEVSARTDDGVILAIRHRRYPTEGVQFHPESLLTPDGGWLLARFIGSDVAPPRVADPVDPAVGASGRWAWSWDSW